MGTKLTPLPKAQRRLLSLARERDTKKRGPVQRNPNRPQAFDALVDLGLLTSDGTVTPKGKTWKIVG